MAEWQFENNRRIVRNSSFLYGRMLLVTVLYLYAARLVLANLGIEDYGVFNVVGGVVTFMGFITNSMSSASHRYLSYYLGRHDSVRLQQTFSLLMTAYVVFSCFSAVVLECFGPYYIEQYLVLPEARRAAALYVFQFALATFIINTLGSPYKSFLIAYEKMDAYAVISILEAILLLGVVIVLGHVEFDRLIAYAGLQLLVYLAINACLAVYCSKRLEGCRLKRYWNKAYFKEVLSYSGWNLFGTATSVMIIQGQAVVLNWFFGPIVNAAKAIADKVNSMVSQFYSSLYSAVAPQIIKSYAVEDTAYMRALVLHSTRYSFLMLFLFSAPLFVVMEPVLGFWLGEGHVSFEMTKFCQLAIVFSLVNVLEQPITMAIRATGDIKKYQIRVGLLTLSFLPLCVILFWLGVPSYYSMILLSGIYLIAQIIRIQIVSPIIGTSFREYVGKVMLPIVLVVLIDALLSLFLSRLGDFSGWSWVLKGVVCLFVAAAVCFFVGLKGAERTMLLEFVRDSMVKK